MIKKILSSFEIMHRLIMVISIAFAMTIFAPAVSAQAVRHASDFNHMKTGFPLTGVHVNVECETCHVGGIFKGTPTACDGCHSPGRRVVAPFKSINHIVTNAACDTCHTNTVSFLGARFNHIGVQPKACITCHNGRMGPGKPGGHVVTVASCDTCHRTSAWVPAGFDHLSAIPPVAARCNQCHNGVQATGKYSQHLVTTASCDSSGCHTNTNYVTFAGLAYNHAGTTPGACGTCHSGQMTGAPTQTPGHIPYTGNGCDNCHLTPPATTSFSTATMNHAAVASLNCSRCHNGSYTSEGLQYGGAKAKTSIPNHVPTSSECNVCHHSFTTFIGATYDHTGVTSGCTNCHGTGTNGAKVKTPGIHIPTSNTCESCHSTSIFASFSGAGATMNHAVEAGQPCSACHSGSYTSQGSKQGGAKAKTSIANHIPVSTECGICHTGFTSFTAPLASSTTMHTAGIAPTACKTCHTSNAYQGVSGDKKSVTHERSSPVPTDCTDSGCHKPGANGRGTAYISW